MDMELRGAPALAAELIHAYATQAQDAELLQLLPFYQCYRAYVRGKVESLKNREPEIPVAEQERARQQQPPPRHAGAKSPDQDRGDAPEEELEDDWAQCDRMRAEPDERAPLQDDRRAP
jgi:hypothetical protein